VPLITLFTTNILYVDADVNNLGFLENQVKNLDLPFNLVTAQSVIESKKIISRVHFDVIFSVYKLGDGTAFDLFHHVSSKLKKFNEKKIKKDITGIKDTKIVILFDESDKMLAKAAMNIGVFDYEIVNSYSDRQEYVEFLIATIYRAVVIYSVREKLGFYPSPVKQDISKKEDQNVLLAKTIDLITKEAMRENIRTRLINDLYYVDYVIYKGDKEFQDKQMKPLFQNIPNLNKLISQWYSQLEFDDMYIGAYTRQVKKRPDLKAILFPITLPETISCNNQYPGKSHCLIVLFYHCAVSDFIPREKMLMKTFLKHVEKVKTIEQLKTEFSTWVMIEEIIEEGRKEAQATREAVNNITLR
jgi:hypothetical protein